MTLIEVQAPQEKAEIIPVNTRDIHLKLMGEYAAKGQNLLRPLEDVLHDRQEAAWHEKMANEPTTDELRQKMFGIPLPDNHPVSPKDRKNEL